MIKELIMSLSNNLHKYKPYLYPCQANHIALYSYNYKIELHYIEVKWCTMSQMVCSLKDGLG